MYILPLKIHFPLNSNYFLLFRKCSGFLYLSKIQICTTVSLFFRDADKVLLGDDVLVYGNDELSSEKVTNISSFAMDGKIFTITMKTSMLSITHYLFPE